MKFRTRHFSLALAALLAIQGVGISNVLAGQELTSPILEETLLFEASHQSSGLKAYDSSPLGNRTPIVLVHGIGGTDTKFFHWDNFLSYADSRKDFTQNYKIYLFHYDSSRPVPELGQDLKRELTRLITRNGNRNIKVVGYSEGGLLTRHAMDDPFVYAHTPTVLTIATPFHGSPLANPDWLRQETAAGSKLSLVKMNLNRVYDITGRRFPTFEKDFGWDNFDSALSMSPNKLLSHNYALDDKKNFITYGSFFGVASTDKMLPEVLDLKAGLPKEEPKFNLFKKNIFFTLIRSNIARLPLAKFENDSRKEQPDVALQEVNLEPKDIVAGGATGIDINITALALAEDKQPAHVAATVNAIQPAVNNELETMLHDPASMMAYNDGISPISSSLWLGRFTPKFSHVTNPVKRLWLSLESLKGNRNTRLFAGLDHRNWMDGTTRTDKNAVQDLLNPDQNSRTVFEWIVADLMG